jgi:hypothetical protein
MKLRFVALLVMLSASACGKGERPFRMVQFCLANTGEIEAVKGVLRGQAATYKLPLYDNSEQTEADLNLIVKGQENTPVAHPTVNIGTIGPTAMGFSAGNFAEAPSQIVVGFSKAGDAIAARQLSNAVLQALAKRWRIHEVLHVEATGAFPLKDCNS